VYDTVCDNFPNCVDVDISPHACFRTRGETKSWAQTNRVKAGKCMPKRSGDGQKHPQLKHSRQDPPDRKDKRAKTGSEATCTIRFTRRQQLPFRRCPGLPRPGLRTSVMHGRLPAVILLIAAAALLAAPATAQCVGKQRYKFEFALNWTDTIDLKIPRDAGYSGLVAVAHARFRYIRGR
jgi:hypothetical protein